MKNNSSFEKVLRNAISGDTDAMSEIIKMYMPLINKHSIQNRKMDEDLWRYVVNVGNSWTALGMGKDKGLAFLSKVQNGIFVIPIAWVLWLCYF